MALQVDWAHAFGYTVPNAYVRINRVNMYHGTTYDVCDIEVQVFENEAIRRSDNPENVDAYHFTYYYDDTQPVTFSDLYTFLKTQEQLITAINV